MGRGSTLSILLTESLERYVEQKVASGDYQSASEVIAGSLRQTKAIEKQQSRFWVSAKRKAALAREQVRRGETMDGDSAMNAITAELQGAQIRRRRKKNSK